MNIFDSIFRRQNHKYNLPVFGEINFEKSHNSEYRYQLFKDDYKLDNSELQLKLYLKRIDKKSIIIVSKLLADLETIHNECKSAYINDFNDKDSIEYITGLYSQTMTESEFNSINQKATPKQKLLAAFMCSSVEIHEKNDGLIVNLDYMYGYEIQLKFIAGNNLKLISCEMQPGSSLGQKQFSDFVSKFEEHAIGEICGRILPDWWNHPIKSYYIYLMTKRLKYMDEI